MAYTTARVWTVGELVTAAQLNEQMRDNETWLDDQFDTATGHDHDGTDSKALAGILPTMAMVTWLPAAVAVWYETNMEGGAMPSGYLIDPYVTSGSQYTDFIFPLTIPLTFHSRTPKITEIKLYGYTGALNRGFVGVYLRRSDLDGTYTDDVSYTTEIFGGEGVNVNATIYSGSLSLGNYPYAIIIRSRAGGGIGNENRIYGIKITWEA